MPSSPAVVLDTPGQVFSSTPSRALPILTLGRFHLTGPAPVRFDSGDRRPAACLVYARMVVPQRPLPDGGWARPLSLCSYFRQARGKNPETGEFEYGHTIAWAISDAGNARYYPSVAVDGSAPQFGLAKLDAGVGYDDVHPSRAAEVLDQARSPGPTRMFTPPRRGKARALSRVRHQPLAQSWTAVTNSR